MKNQNDILMELSISLDRGITHPVLGHFEVMLYVGNIAKNHTRLESK